MPPIARDGRSLAGVTASKCEPQAPVCAPFEPALSLEEVFDQILRGAIEYLDVERADLYLLDERETVLVGQHGLLRDRTGGRQTVSGVRGAKIPITDTLELMSAAVLTRSPRFIDEANEAERRDEGNLVAKGRDPHHSGSFAVAPLTAGGRALGAIAFYDAPGSRSLRGKNSLLEGFGMQAGLAVERARLFEDRGRALKELTDLLRVTAALQGSLPLSEIGQRIVDGAVEVLGVDRAILFLYDPDRNLLEGAAAGLSRTAEEGGKGDPRAQLSRVVRGIGIPVAGMDEALSAVVVGRRPISVDVGQVGLDSPAGMRIAEPLLAKLQLRWFAAAPLRGEDRVMGVLVLDNISRKSALSERLHLLLAYTGQAGLAIGRTLVEESLRASERRYRQFIERSPDGIVESSLDGRILACNDALLKLLGYEREELMGMNAREVYVDPAQREQLLRANTERGQVEEMEIAVKRKDGGIAYVSASTRLRQGSGEPVLEAIVRDVTERYEVERRLRTLTDVVTYSADGIISLDAGARISSWNKGAELMLGYTAQEVTGKPYQTIVPPELMQELCEVIKPRVEKEGHLQGFETERLHKDGRRIPVSATVTRLRDVPDGNGPDLGWSVILRDITQRKRDEEQRRLLSSITEQSPDGILSIDPEGKITSWNRGAERMFGYAAAEIVGRPWLDLAPFDREEEYRMVTARPAAAGSALGPDDPRVVDTLARTREGRLLPVRLSATVLRSGEAGNGHEVGWTVILRDLTEQKNLAEISERLQEELYSRNRLEGIVGNSRDMEEVRDRIRRVSRFNSSVMLVGQSGTGKEVVANAIHYNSLRRQRPLIKVNCAAIPEDLLESELFGIESNVATGVDGRIGRFEMADGGTLFLDEIGDMSLPTQAKILRVLQEREFERVGGKQVIKVDVRIIAATNKDLESEIKARRFREDLYYRLNVIVITLPPLCQRREDIDPLIDHFLAKVSRENDLPRKKLSLKVRMLLNEYDWPGNVRELQHCIERAVVMGEEPEIEETDLPPHILFWKELGGQSPAIDSSGRRGLPEILHQAERRAVLEALQRSGWVQARAARMLGISERSMWYRVKKLGLERPAR